MWKCWHVHRTKYIPLMPKVGLIVYTEELSVFWREKRNRYRVKELIFVRRYKVLSFRCFRKENWQYLKTNLTILKIFYWIFQFLKIMSMLSIWETKSSLLSFLNLTLLYLFYRFLCLDLTIWWIFSKELYFMSTCNRLI